MMAAIFIFIIGVTRNCGRLATEPIEGFSRGDTLDVAIIYGPGSYYIYSDSLAGINHEIANEFSNETGVPIKLWAIANSANGMNKLDKGAFDILASLPLDNYIKNRYPVSESIFLDRLVLVQLADSTGEKRKINSSLDLNGKTVYVSGGSSALQRMKNLSDEIGGNIDVVEEPELSDELLTIKVANGSLPFAIVNEKVARKVADSYPELNYDSSVSFTQFQVWLFNPTDSILPEKFNKWFEDFRTTDTYRTIISNY